MDAVTYWGRGPEVGHCETADGQWHAFLWRGGRMHDLDGAAAVAINDRGQILGYRSGIAVLWEPRPTR